MEEIERQFHLTILLCEFGAEHVLDTLTASHSVLLSTGVVLNDSNIHLRCEKQLSR